MQTSLLGLILVSLLPFHDFHTTIMNFKYQDDEKTYQIDLMMDSEHFQHVINTEYDVKLNLGESNEHEKADSLIEDYINDKISCKLNKKKVVLELKNKNVTFAETTLYFKDVCYKRKLKSVSMTNNFMIHAFPSQKNLVNIKYKGEQESMLFDQDNSNLKVEF